MSYGDFVNCSECDSISNPGSVECDKDFCIQYYTCPVCGNQDTEVIV